MDNKKPEVKVLGILIILFVVYSAVVFLLPFKRNVVFWISYLFTVVALVMQEYIFQLSFMKSRDIRSKFYGFPIVRIGAIYLIAQIILCFIFMIFASILPIWVPMIFYILLLAAATIGLITVDTMRDEINRQDKKLETNTTSMRALQNKANVLSSRCNDEKLVLELQKLAEDFKYSDPVSSNSLAEIEKDLSIMLDDLEQILIDNDTVGASSLCKKIMVKLAERNQMCKYGKQNKD